MKTQRSQKKKSFMKEGRESWKFKDIYARWGKKHKKKV